MIEYYEFARKLRDLARQFDDPAVFMPIVKVAEEYEAAAEALELEFIVQQQRDWVETSG